MRGFLVGHESILPAGRFGGKARLRSASYVAGTRPARGAYAEPTTTGSTLERVPSGLRSRTICAMRWSDPEVVRALVVVEPALFRSAIARVLEGAGGIEVAVDDPTRLTGTRLARMLHPSGGVDVILASPGLAGRLALTGIPVIEMPDAGEPAITFHRAGTDDVRRAATLRSLLQLVAELAGPAEPAAEAQ